MIVEKRYARRSVVGYKSPYADPFTYRSTAESERREILAILGRVIEGSLSREWNASVESKYESMVEFANVAYDPKYWMVAYDDDVPAGLVFAQRYFDVPNKGSLFIVGLVPEYRGQGFGRVLHAKGLELLAEMGVENYVGSTDLANAPMLRVFEANGCELRGGYWVELETGEKV